MADESIMARVDSERKGSGMESFVSLSADLRGSKMCVEYTSALAVERIANSEGLARTRQGEPIRRRDEDLHLLQTLHERCKWQRDEDLYHLEQKNP